MKFIIVLLGMLLCSEFAFTQISYEKRIEFEIKDDHEKESIRIIGDDGIMISSLSKKATGKTRECRYQFFNTNLDELQSRSFDIDKKKEVVESFITKDKVFDLYLNKAGDYELINIKISNLETNKIFGEFQKYSETQGMVVLGDNAYIITTFNYAPSIQIINWKTGKKNSVPLHFEKFRDGKLKVIGFQVLEESKEVLIIVNAIKNKFKGDVFVVAYDESANKKFTFKLTEDIEEKIISASATRLEGDKLVFTGTYSTKNNIESQGIFFCIAQNRKIDFITYHSFSNLKNFFNYLPKQKQERMQERAENMREKDKTLKVNHYIASHGIIELDSGYMYLGEVYHPTYKEEYYTETVTVNGVTKTITKRKKVFDGYLYTHAILVKFDLNGDILWDEALSLFIGEKPHIVKRYISIAEGEQNAIKLVYANKRIIVLKSIGFDGKVIQGKKSEEIETGESGDKTLYSRSNIEYWYDNYFVAFGEQKVKNTEKSEKRKVYFLNKIKFE